MLVMTHITNPGRTNFSPNTIFTFPSTESLTPRRHYRLVLDNIGHKLERFCCSWEIVNAVYAALVGALTNSCCSGHPMQPVILQLTKPLTRSAFFIATLASVIS